MLNELIDSTCWCLPSFCVNVLFVNQVAGYFKSSCRIFYTSFFWTPHPGLKIKIFSFWRRGSLKQLTRDDFFSCVKHHIQTCQLPDIFLPVSCGHTTQVWKLRYSASGGVARLNNWRVMISFHVWNMSVVFRIFQLYLSIFAVIQVWNNVPTPPWWEP